jgi:apolipoprotein N-acyltransferase
MPWELLGHTQYRALWLVQIADLGGVPAVSFVMTLASVAAAELIADARTVALPSLRPVRRLLPAAAMLVATFAYGVDARARYASGDEATTVTVAVVQGNIPNEYRWQRAHMERTLAAYAGLTRSTLGARPALVVWPENAVDFYLEREPMLRTQLAQVAASAPGGLLVGSPRLATETDARNSAQLLAADGTIRAVYDKQRLVPFAESTLFPSANADMQEPAYGPGPRAEPIASSVGRLGTMICYEVLFARLVNDLVRRGAQVLVNLSNDSWLDGGDGAAPEQHFSMAVLTAIETRRDLVRAAGSGASGFIDASGRVVARLPRNESGTLVERVRLRDELTPYVRWGDAWILATGIVLAAACAPAYSARLRA